MAADRAGVMSSQLLAITAPDAGGHQALWVIGDGDGAVQPCVLE